MSVCLRGLYCSKVFVKIMGKNKENMHVYCLFLLGMEIRTSDVDQKIKTIVKMELMP